MNNFNEGDVVIVLTTQAGTIIDLSDREVTVLLQNNDIWRGLIREVRHPQSKEDLETCPIEVDRFKGR